MVCAALQAESPMTFLARHRTARSLWKSLETVTLTWFRSSYPDTSSSPRKEPLPPSSTIQEYPDTNGTCLTPRTTTATLSGGTKLQVLMRGATGGEPTRVGALSEVHWPTTSLPAAIIEAPQLTIQSPAFVKPLSRIGDDFPELVASGAPLPADCEPQAEHLTNGSNDVPEENGGMLKLTAKPPFRGNSSKSRGLGGTADRNNKVEGPASACGTLVMAEFHPWQDKLYALPGSRPRNSKSAVAVPSASRTVSADEATEGPEAGQAVQLKRTANGSDIDSEKAVASRSRPTKPKVGGGGGPTNGSTDGDEAEGVPADSGPSRELLQEQLKV
mmetsp:Transcript_35371/g.114550  ORF Transcript_35371/g.114550 Transcript_35371/m.114550 type:complete len:330 (-) Transcript_35371:1243-2232(-)